MWHTMFAEQIPVAEKILRTVIVYAVVAILIRVTGKRELSGLNNLDIVVMILLANVVQNAIIGNDLSITGAVIGAVTLLIVDSLLNRAALYSDRLARLLDGTDTTVVRDGRIDAATLRRLGLRRAEIEHAVRIQNGDDLADVQTGVLEASGQLLVTLRPDAQGATKSDVDALRRQLAGIELALGLRS